MIKKTEKARLVRMAARKVMKNGDLTMREAMKLTIDNGDYKLLHPANNRVKNKQEPLDLGGLQVVTYVENGWCYSILQKQDM